MIVTHKMAEAACEALGWGHETLTDDLTQEGVSAQFRVAAAKAHPDAGGSPEAFAEVSYAKRVLIEWIRRGKPGPVVRRDMSECPMCGGRGSVTVQRGWRALAVSCKVCRGSGEVDVNDVGEEL